MCAEHRTSHQSKSEMHTQVQRIHDLESKEQRYRATFYSISEGIITTDNEQYIQQINPVAESLTGWTESEARGRPIDEVYRVVDEQTRQPGRNLAAMVLGRGSSIGMLNHSLLVARDGTERAIMDSGAPIRNKRGAIIGAVLVFRDQTHERLARRYIETRLALIDYAAEHSLDQLLIRALDEVGNFVESPIGFYHFVAPDQKTLSLQQWSTRTLEAFRHTERHELHHRIDKAGVWLDCIRQKKPVIHSDDAALAHQKDLPEGHPKMIRELVVPVMREEKVVAILGVGNKPTDYNRQDVEIVSYLADVTWQIVRQKRADQGLRTAHHQMQSLLQAVPDQLLVIDRNYDILYSNAKGVGQRVPLMTDAANTCHAQFKMLKRPCKDCNARSVFETGQSIEREMPPSADGRLCEVRAFPIHNSAGDVEAVVEHIRDVTEHKQAEQALLAHQRAITMNNRIANAFLTASSDEMYAKVIAIILETLESSFGFLGYMDDAGDLVCPTITVDIKDQYPEGELGMVLPRSAWTGLWGDSLIEKRTCMTNESIQAPKGKKLLGNALVVPIVLGDILIGQIAVANKPGGYSAEDQSLLEKAAAHTAPVLKAMRDKVHHQQEHLKLKEQYHQFQKLESIGRLAGGIAHDLNNLLTPIIGYGEMLLEDISKESVNHQSLSEVVKAGMRAQDLVRQLLAFSRKQTLEFKPIELNPLLQNFKGLLRRTIREDVHIIFKPAKALPLIQGDAGQLEQVIMNLAVNAQDAMPTGGTLTIETAETTLDDHFAQNHQGVIPGPYVMLTVRDTGTGMEENVRKHLFEPFFTTKSKDKGTGLGLSTVYGIVKQHRGNIWCHSLLGHGATFKIYLPVSNQAEVPETPFQEILDTSKGTETILLVEDDKQVRRITQTILEQRGYHLLVAGNGIDALNLLKTHQGIIHMLLTDVVMPEMNGRELHEAVSHIFPKIKTLYMSGYTGSVIAQHGVMDAGLNFISKPFSITDLTRKVREVLDQS